MGRPTRCSSSTPCALTLTSSAPMAAPNSVSAAPSATASHANAGSTSVAADASVDTDATIRLPACAISQPESGIATSDPAPRPASAPPSAAGDSASATCTSGSRDTHVANAKPRTKNSVPMAIRAARMAAADEASGMDPGSNAGMPMNTWDRLSRNDPAFAGGRRVRANPVHTGGAVAVVRDRYRAGSRANAAARPAVDQPGTDPPVDRRQDEGLRQAGRLRPALLEPRRWHDLARDPGARFRAALLHVAVGGPRLERHRPRSRPARGLARGPLPADRKEGAAGGAELRVPGDQRQPRRA